MRALTPASRCRSTQAGRATACPGPTLVGAAATRVVDKAMDIVGGSGFYRAAGFERLFRDVQGARYHRPQQRTQLRFTGRLVLGLDPEE